jgi:hypothetical protein
MSERIHKDRPTIHYLNLNVDGNPLMLEEVTSTKVRYGSATDGSPIVACQIDWDFKAFDTFRNNTKTIDSLVTQVFRFLKPLPFTYENAKEIINQSFEDSRRLLERELKNNAISHLPMDLPQEDLIKYSQILYDDLKMRLR